MNAHEVRRRALLDAASVLRSWLSCCNGIEIKHTSANGWARAGMDDCIEEIERMAADAVPPTSRVPPDEGSFW